MTDADELLKSLRQPIAVVGNGTMVWRHDEIESFPTIIRFNNYADVNWEHHIGHSVHVWCVTCCGDVKYRTFSTPVRVMTIATIDEQTNQIGQWLERYPDMAVPKESWIRAARDFKGRNPTTGLTLLLRMLHHRMQFAAFGFDGCRSGHYWDKLHLHTPSHGDELEAILKLAKRGVQFV